MGISGVSLAPSALPCTVFGSQAYEDQKFHSHQKSSLDPRFTHGKLLEQNTKQASYHGSEHGETPVKVGKTVVAILKVTLTNS